MLAVSLNPTVGVWQTTETDEFVITFLVTKKTTISKLDMTLDEILTLYPETEENDEVRDDWPWDCMSDEYKKRYLDEELNELVCQRGLIEPTLEYWTERLGCEKEYLFRMIATNDDAFFNIFLMKWAGNKETNLDNAAQYLLDSWIEHFHLPLEKKNVKNFEQLIDLMRTEIHPWWLLYVASFVMNNAKVNVNEHLSYKDTIDVARRKIVMWLGE